MGMRRPRTNSPVTSMGVLRLRQHIYTRMRVPAEYAASPVLLLAPPTMHSIERMHHSITHGGTDAASLGGHHCHVYASIICALSQRCKCVLTTLLPTSGLVHHLWEEA